MLFVSLISLDAMEPTRGAWLTILLGCQFSLKESSWAKRSRERKTIWVPYKCGFPLVSSNTLKHNTKMGTEPETKAHKFQWRTKSLDTRFVGLTQSEASIDLRRGKSFLKYDGPLPLE